MLLVCFLGLIISLLMTSCSTPLKLNNQYRTNVAPAAEESYKSQQAEASSFSQQSFFSKQRAESIKESKVAKIDASNIEVPVRAFSAPATIQVKYASLLNMLPGMLTNIRLLETIDEWYGTRYRYGGTTKSGIDCSAFVRAVYKVAFGIDLPRTAREQFRAAALAVSNLQTGDLLFFNTSGGISHVGMYLGNNKFVHASTSRGVIVSDLDENYYAARYLGARRMSEPASYAVN